MGPSKSTKKEHSNVGMPFTPTIQHARTVMKTLICVECEKPRVCYAAKKLKQPALMELERCVDGYCTHVDLLSRT